MIFSARTGWDRHPNRLAALLAEKKTAQKQLFDLTESNPTRCGFPLPDGEWLSALSDPRNLRYEPDPRGLLEAREAVCRYYSKRGVQLAPAQIFLTAGTSEAYSYLFHLLADPGEAILCPRPSYPLFGYLSDWSGTDLCPYRLEAATNWKLTPESLNMAWREDLKAVLVVNPNNPTGHFISAEEEKQLNIFCGKNRAALISDEVFLDFAFDGKARRTLAADAPTLRFVLGGVSKAAGLPQMKLSWIAVLGPGALREEAEARLEVLADIFLSAGTPSQRALPSWLDKSEAFAGAALSHLKENRAFLEQALSRHSGARLLPAEGGWYAVLSLSVPGSDEEAAYALLKEDDVFVHPGYFFDFEGDFLVLSLLTPAAIFREGVSRLSKRLKKTG